MTDEARRYERLGDEFAAHSAVDHSRGEYGYTDRKNGAKVSTNTVEGYYSIFKRGMKGVYQHCSEQHLTAISRNLTSVIQTASRWAWTTKSALDAQLPVRLASALPINELIARNRLRRGVAKLRAILALFERSG